MGLALRLLVSPGMRGFITDQHLEEADAEFPGISAFYAASREKPCTFLDLVVRYQRFLDFVASALCRFQA